MAQSFISFRFAAAGMLAIVVSGLSTAQAQVIRAPLTDGFTRTSSIAMSVDEMLGIKKNRSANEPIAGPGYPSLFICEIQYKPVRLRRLELPDPKTGEIRKELVRYMVWRAIPRDYTELAGAGKADLERKLADPATDPSNALDPETVLPLRMPRFVLQTEDKSGKVLETYLDEISVEVQNIVFHREMGRRGLNLKLMNSIEAISEIGDPVPGDDPDALSKAVYGVAVWRNVDPHADFFSVTMSGFSNAYRISDTPDGRLLEEKVVVQKFARPGDQFLQEELEFRLIDEGDTDGDGKLDTRYPAWQYKPRQVQLEIRDLESVLRNARREPTEPTEK
jgi:hypothetical protein